MLLRLLLSICLLVLTTSLSLRLLGSVTSQSLCLSRHGTVPIGINLGVVEITAACLSNERVPIPLVRIAASVAYRAYMNDTLDYQPVYDSLSRRKRRTYAAEQRILAPPEIYIPQQQAQDIFQAEFLKVLLQIQQVHQLTAKVESVVSPDHFNASSKAMVMQAVELVSGGMTHQREIYSSYCALANTYTGECGARQFDGDPKYVVVLDYQTYNLEMMVGVVTNAGACLHGRQSVALRETPSLTAEWKDAGQVRQALDDVVEAHLTPSRDNPAPRLEAIVLGGQITREVIQWLGDAVESSIPSSRRLTRTSNPEYRGAFGAACQMFPPGLDGVRSYA